MPSESVTTFEKRFSDWMTIHPPSNFLGKDEEIFLSQQFSRVVEAQLTTTDRIIASQEDIADGIDKVALGIDEVSKGLERLRETFEWGFTEVIWRIEQSNEKLQEILQVLQAPLDTQAKELKKRGDDAYRNGWFDDAIKDFLESEKNNRYDFTIHQNLGYIYLFHKNNPIKALEYFKKAVKYATPKSPRHASFSFLHVGLINYLQENYQRAYESTSNALKLSPNYYEAHYQHAQYCAVLGKKDEAVQHLRIAFVEGGIYFCIKACSEKDFDVMRKKVIALFNELRDEACNQARCMINEVEKLMQEAMAYNVTDKSIVAAKEKLNKVKRFLKRRSYLGFLKAIGMAKDIKKEIAYSLNNRLNDIISELEKKIKELNRKTEPKDSYSNTLIWLILAILILIPTFFFGQLLASLMAFNHAIIGAVIFYFILLFTFPAFWDWMTLRHYLPLIKKEEDKLNKLKEKLSYYQRLLENIILNYGRKKVFTEKFRFNYREEMD